jgi:hypothetical protein
MVLGSAQCTSSNSTTLGRWPAICATMSTSSDGFLLLALRAHVHAP